MEHVLETFRRGYPLEILGENLGANPIAMFPFVATTHRQMHEMVLTRRDLPKATCKEEEELESRIFYNTSLITVRGRRSIGIEYKDVK